MSAQDEVPEARVTLVAKVNILISAIDVKCKTLFACHQSSTADNSTVDRPNQAPINNRLHLKYEDPNKMKVC